MGESEAGQMSNGVKWSYVISCASRGFRSPCDSTARACNQVYQHWLSSVGEKSPTKGKGGTDLCDDLGVRGVRVDKPSRKHGGSGVVARFSKHPHGATKRELEMGGPDLAVRKVGRELEVARDIVGLLGDQATTFRLHR